MNFNIKIAALVLGSMMAADLHAFGGQGDHAGNGVIGAGIGVFGRGVSYAAHKSGASKGQALAAGGLVSALLTAAAQSNGRFDVGACCTQIAFVLVGYAATTYVVPVEDTPTQSGKGSVENAFRIRDEHRARDARS